MVGFYMFNLYAFRVVLGLGFVKVGLERASVSVVVDMSHLNGGGQTLFNWGFPWPLHARGWPWWGRPQYGHA